MVKRAVKQTLLSLFRKLPFFHLPKGYLKNSLEWIKEPAKSWSIREATQFEVETPADHNLPADLTLARLETSPAIWGVRIPGARLYQGTVISPDSQVLLDLTLEKDPRNVIAFSMLSLPPLQVFAGEVALISEPFSASYFHFFLIALPRFLYLLEKYPLEKIDFIAVSHCTENFHREILEALSIPSSKIIRLEKTPHIKVGALLTTTQTNRHPETYRILRKYFLPKEGLKGKRRRIYLSRARARGRRITNEEEVLKILSPLGFETVYCEALSIQEQIATFAQAEVLIGPHGANFVNTVFCAPGTKVIEFFDLNYHSDEYWRIAGVLGLDYYCIMTGIKHPIVVPETPEQWSARTQRNIELPIDELQEILRLAEVHP